MRNIYPLLSLLLLTLFPLWGQEQPNWDEAQISLITVGPGKNLYDKFGHTAIRVQDGDLDIAFNYGTYDFNTPNFYLKFARGKLLYKLSTNYFPAFLEYYQGANRWVKEQVLDLNTQQKRQLFATLQENMQPENREYLYDFFYDNCATKPRDILFTSPGMDVSIAGEYARDSLSFRQLIQQNVHWNSWGSLGMDVAIGAVTDRRASAWEYQFLPFYVSEAAAEAMVPTKGGEKALVASTSMLFENDPQDDRTPFLLSPLFCFLLVGLLIFYFTWNDQKQGKRSRWLDGLIFGITGLVGLILSLLWWATDHGSTVNNYNLLWAFPFSLLLIPMITKASPRRWVRRYVVFLLLMMVLMLIHSITGVQEFAPAFIPFFVALAARYVYLIRTLPK